ncbi:sensor histidine kinase [Arthrobacter sp. A5]|uniref:sensor histidine kinase n=1 Tax=Arthrobacter sp. A5 TaxID=576926 RepID=UPI003DA8848F
MFTVLPRAIATLSLRRQFHELRLSERLFLSQSPLVFCTAIVAAVVAVVHPEDFAKPGFLCGLVLLAVLTAVCLLVPWERSPKGTYWVIPLADFVAVGLLHSNTSNAAINVSLLAIFPVFWLAWSGIAPRAARIISFLVPLLIVWYPVFTSGRPVTAGALAVPFLIPVVLTCVSIAASVVDLSTTTQQRAFEENDRRLQQTLRDSNRRGKLLDTVLNTVEMGVLAVDKDGHKFLTNTPQRAYHRRATPEGVEDPIEAELLIFGADRVTPMPADLRPMRRAILGESFSDHLIWVGVGKQQRALTTSARAIRDDDGALVGHVVAFNDVTDLVTALATKDDFVANVSHELRTPLTSILGYLDLVLEDEAALPEGAAASLQTAVRNSERLLQLVSDLLSTAAAQISVKQESSDLVGVILVSLDSARPRAAEAGVELAADLPERLHVFIDPQRMGQVLDNLLSNAIKYSPDGGTITVRAWTAGGNVAFQVDDAGMGISEADQREVFAKFFRADSVRKAAIPGVGLGLAISRSIVEAHRGTISLTSRPAAGAVFTVTLPLETPPPPCVPGLTPTLGTLAT